MIQVSSDLVRSCAPSGIQLRSLPYIERLLARLVEPINLDWFLNTIFLLP